ncbi:MAG: zinc ribbon domain-containing protein [Firmicutes bacterium]|nr:zinc ribbon domain-containing protein [Bacillota bacterium]
MPEKQRAQHLKCPQCGETVLPDDKFCFHCGRRLKYSAEETEGPERRVPEWPLAILGGMAMVGALYIIHHQTHLLGQLRTHLKPRPVAAAHAHQVRSRGRAQPPVPIALHPVVTTTTTYPQHVPSSASWTLVQETYRNVRITLRVPHNMSATLSATPAAWIWGQPHTPYRVSVTVVSARPADATEALGTGVYGTAIQRTPSEAVQSLFIRWASNAWLDVSMAVPNAHVNWLAAIAESVRIS